MRFQKNDNLFDKAKGQLEKEKPFVLFRRPNETFVNGVFQNNQTVNQLSNYDQKGFVFTSFSGNRQTIVLADELLSGVFLERRINKSSLQFDIEKGKATHLELVAKAITRIKQGELEKVVVSRHIEVVSEASSIELFSILVKKYSNAFCYLFFHPEIGLWIGATPEQFLKIEDNQLYTTALAGTLSFEEGKAPNWTQKELKEQEMVTNHIVDNLIELKLNPKTEGPKNKKAGNLWHLNTKVSAATPNKDLISKIVEALHPTPAVCGLPTKKAKSFIEKNENYDREYYTGFLGELNLRNENNINLFVNLRCMQLHNSVARIYVGGGITKDSIPGKEWEETVNKSRTMLDLFLS